MKRITGILLVTVYMLSFAELHNLLRVPLLITHFQEHQEENPDIGFWSFMRMHYEGPIVVDDDYDRDQQLPFRDADCCVVVLQFSCECPEVAYELSSMDIINTEFSLYHESSKRLLAAYDFFQPPRFA